MLPPPVRKIYFQPRMTDFGIVILKVDHLMPLFVDHLWQLASKLVTSFGNTAFTGLVTDEAEQTDRLRTSCLH